MNPSVRALIVVGLACFSASGLAQVNNGELPPDTYHRKNLRSRNFDMSVEVTRFTNATPKIMKVTGTNEKFEIKVTLGFNANPRNRRALWWSRSNRPRTTKQRSWPHKKMYSPTARTKRTRIQ